MDKRFGVLGENIEYSLSPYIFEKFNIKGYEIFNFDGQKASEFLDEKDLKFVNITTPYKDLAYKSATVCSEQAFLCRSVNLLTVCDGVSFGYNTDVYGFIALVKKNGVKIKGKNVVILGSGGAGRAVEVACGFLKAKKITVVSRTGEVNYQNVYGMCKDAQIIVNATPVGGTKIDGTPLNLCEFHGLSAVIDLIYAPYRTQLLLDALRLKIKAVNGLYMLCAQALKTFEIAVKGQTTDGKKPNAKQLREIDKIYSDILLNKYNIILAGMPGAGKTTVGKILAKMLDRKFIDVDYEYIDTFGVTTAQDIESIGIEKFREKETQVVINTSKKKGLIATGGGAVLKKENGDALKSSGITVLIGRKLSKLDTTGRPLLKNNDPKKLYNERKDIYNAFADLKVSNDKTPEDTAKKIIKLIEKM